MSSSNPFREKIRGHGCTGVGHRICCVIFCFFFAEKMRVLLTVPHAACPPINLVGSHFCDFDASDFALLISSYLPGSVVLASDIHRDYAQIASDGFRGSDENRPDGRETEFRKTFLGALEKKDFQIVLDIHSFPADTKSSFKDKSIVILNPDSVQDDFSEKLFSFLSPFLHDKIALMLGSKSNYIVTQARSAGVYSTLLEFREGFHEKEQSSIAQMIVSAVESFIANKG